MRRDRELVEWIGRLGAVEVRHVGERFGVGRSVAYGLVARLSEAGLLERLSLLRGEPALIRATADGLRFVNLGLSVAQVRLGELRFAEQVEGKPIASCVIGELPGGREMLHRPDLAVTGGEPPIAVEVELTPKASARLKAIVKAWRRARHVESVIYLCPAGPTQRAVEAAVRELHAGERVQVRTIEERQ